MALPSFSGTLGSKRAAHLLHRASFGPTKELIDSFSTLTANQAVTQLFQQPLPDPILPIDSATNKEWFLSGINPTSKGKYPSTGQGDYFFYQEKDVQEAAKVLSGWEMSIESSSVINSQFQNLDPDTLLPRGKVKGGKTNASSHDRWKTTYRF